MRVYVYFNLHKKVWSVRALEGEHKGRVIAHRLEVDLENCTCRVSEAGRQRVLRERRKNVHAGIVGTLLENANTAPLPGRLTYNPYRDSTFIDVDTRQAVHGARRVAFRSDGVCYASA